MFRLPSIALLALTALSLAACGNVAGATPPVAPPDLPAAPPLSQEAQQALDQPTAVVPPAPEPAVGTQSVALFSNDFSANTLSDWKLFSFSERPEGPATWTVENGELLQGGTAFGTLDPDSVYLATGDAAWADYTVTTAAYANPGGRAGLIARYSERGYYQLWLDADAGATSLVLAVVQNEETRVLGRTPVAAGSANRWLGFELSVRGATITGTLDGTTVVRAEDTSLSAGQPGLYATALGATRFDNFVVSE